MGHQAKQPLSILKQICKHDPSNKRSVTGAIASLNELTLKLHCLGLQKEQLQQQHDLILGIWLSSRQAARFQAAGLGGDVGRQGCEAVRAANEVESWLLSQTGDPLAMATDPLQAWMPLEASPGSSRELLVRHLDPSSLGGPAGKSFLGGMPLSLLLSLLICITYDPVVVDKRLHAPKLGQNTAAVAKAAADKHTTEIQELLSKLDSVDPNSPGYPQLLSSLALCLMMNARVALVADLFSPSSSIDTFIFTSGEKYLPPDALLDQITDDMGLSQDQVQDMGRLVTSFSKLLDPLSKEKAALLSRTAKLLATEQQPRESTASSGPPSTAAAAALACGSGFLAAYEAQSAAAAAEAAVAAGFPLGDVNYHELLSLMSQLDALQAKIHWLDNCCMYACFGVLTWRQLGKLMTSFKPFMPLPGLWVRRLMARTSLPCLLPLWTYYRPSEAPKGAAAAAMAAVHEFQASAAEQAAAAAPAGGAAAAEVPAMQQWAVGVPAPAAAAAVQPQAAGEAAVMAAVQQLLATGALQAAVALQEGAAGAASGATQADVVRDT